MYMMFLGFFFNAKYALTCITVKHWYLMYTHMIALPSLKILSNSRNAAIKVNVIELLNS